MSFSTMGEESVQGGTTVRRQVFDLRQKPCQCETVAVKDGIGQGHGRKRSQETRGRRRRGPRRGSAFWGATCSCMRRRGEFVSDKPPAGCPRPQAFGGITASRISLTMVSVE